MRLVGSARAAHADNGGVQSHEAGPAVFSPGVALSRLLGFGAVGAAIALTLDWRTIRVLLDISAQRLEMTVPRCTLPDLRDTARVAAQVAETPAVERAIAFGAQQLIAQHSGLWDLLAARAASRAHS